MSRKKRDLSEDEKALWRRVARTVKPRRPVIEPAEPGRSPDAAKPRAGAHPAKAPAPAKKSPSPPAAKPRTVTRPLELKPADRGAEKRVRRGKLEIDAKLDLHGYMQDGAYTALATFLQSAHRRNARVALVVTGVGRTGIGVLKQRLPDWLAARELKPLISGYAQAHRAHGGAGAFYVFLKRKD